MVNERTPSPAGELRAAAGAAIGASVALHSGGTLGVRLRRMRIVGKLAVAIAVMATVASAIVVKELQTELTQPLVAVDAASLRPVVLADEALESDVSERILASNASAVVDPTVLEPTIDEPALEESPLDDATAELARNPEIRWFNGRPVRPAKAMTMTVTAYSPDWRSCGDSADGITATLHPVTANGHALVAADPRVLRYGSMLTIPGYDDGRIVPVLDCGGAIKGRRLDVLYRTHAEARKWGVQKLKVVVWEYADGQPAENPRRVR